MSEQENRTPESSLVAVLEHFVAEAKEYAAAYGTPPLASVALAERALLEHPTPESVAAKTMQEMHEAMGPIGVPPADMALIEKLEAKRYTDDDAGREVTGFMDGWNDAVDTLVAIVRQHQGKLMGEDSADTRGQVATSPSNMGGVTAGEADSTDSSASYRDNNPAPPATPSADREKEFASLASHIGSERAYAIINNLRQQPSEICPSCGNGGSIHKDWHTANCRSEISVGSLLKTIIANDVLIRNMQHRDARWHDDPDVQKVLEANTRVIQAGSTEPDEGETAHQIYERLSKHAKIIGYELRKPEPVSFSHCARAAMKAHWNDGEASTIDDITKAVLDAAGVPYAA